MKNFIAFVSFLVVLLSSCSDDSEIKKNEVEIEGNGLAKIVLTLSKTFGPGTDPTGIGTNLVSMSSSHFIGNQWDSRGKTKGINRMESDPFNVESGENIMVNCVAGNIASPGCFTMTVEFFIGEQLVTKRDFKDMGIRSINTTTEYCANGISALTTFAVP